MNKAAQALGRLGGRATSKAKAEAARANGAKGGRPKKTAAATLSRATVRATAGEQEIG